MAEDERADEPLLIVEDLEKHYPIAGGMFGREAGAVHAVDGVSFTLDTGETLGLVGESGCGKSTLATSLLGLEVPTGGSVRFDGRDVTGLSGQARRRFRREAQLVFQDPDSSFDPRMTVGESVTEPLRIHGLADRDRRREVGIDIIETVGLTAADFDRYPHEFSGGQRQRLALARALVVNPRLLVADEPVSALDASVQSEILALLADLQAELGLAVLFISHDLSVVRAVCDRVAVMYLGEIVEVGPTASVFEAPGHPYTEALLSAIPEPVPGRPDDAVRLGGAVPDATNPPPGCRFHTRCPAVIQPEGVDVDQQTWRRILDARDRLVDGRFEVAGLQERGSGTSLEATIRSELDVPDRVDDPDLDRAMERAVDALAERDPGRAAQELAAAFETPCERAEPEPQPVGADHEAACLLHSPGAKSGRLDREGGFVWEGDRRA